MRRGFSTTRADRACGSIEQAPAESYGDLRGNPGFRGGHRSIGFLNKGRYFLIGTGTTVPAGIKKYLKSYIQSTNLAYQP